VTRLWAECSRNCGSKGKQMHKRRKLKKKMKKRECQSGRKKKKKKQRIWIKMEIIRNVKESIRQYGINIVRNHNFFLTQS
jgi:hypothetical protein